MKERRSLERFKLKLPSKVEMLAAPQGEEKSVLKLFTSNVSSGGAFFPVSKPLPQGTPVKVSLLLDNANLRLQLAAWTLVEVRGAVLRSEPSGMVIAFEPNYKIIPHTKSKVLFPVRGTYEKKPMN
jgi:PilZ domain